MQYSLSSLTSTSQSQRTAEKYFIWTVILNIAFIAYEVILLIVQGFEDYFATYTNYVDILFLGGSLFIVLVNSSFPEPNKSVGSVLGVSNLVISLMINLRCVVHLRCIDGLRSIIQSLEAIMKKSSISWCS